MVCGVIATLLSASARGICADLKAKGGATASCRRRGGLISPSMAACTIWQKRKYKKKTILLENPFENKDPNIFIRMRFYRFSILLFRCHFPYVYISMSR